MAVVTHVCHRTGQAGWTVSRPCGLQEPGEIRIGLPTAILMQGEYDLELSRLEGDTFNKIADYELTVFASSDTLRE